MNGVAKAGRPKVAGTLTLNPRQTLFRIVSGTIFNSSGKAEYPRLSRTKLSPGAHRIQVYSTAVASTFGAISLYLTAYVGPEDAADPEPDNHPAA